MVYAHDVSAGVKREQAKGLLHRLWDSGDGVLSIQVLQELFVALTRKVPHPLGAGSARAIMADMATWRVVEPTGADVLQAIDAAGRWNISFWDAMVLVAAKKAGAAVLWTEDLNDGQNYDGTVARNPFRQPA